MTKAPAKEKDTEFNILVAEVDKARVDEAAEAFSAAFGLEAAVAQQIVKSAPIVFLTNATKAEIKAITPRLIEVSKSGIEFRVTTQSVQRIPKVNWPVRPQFAFGAGPADAGHSATYNFERNIFVCPCCGETFLFRRVGRPPLGGEKQETPEAAPAPKPAPAAKHAPKPGAAFPPALDETSVPQAAVEPEEALEPAEPADNLLAEEPPAEEPLLPTEEVLNPEDQPALAPTPAPEPKPEPEPEPEPVLDEQPLLEESPEEDEVPPPPPPPAPKPAPAAPKPVPAPAPRPAAPAAAPKPAPAPAPAPKPAPAAPPPEAAAEDAESTSAPSGTAGDSFNVFLSKITSNDKKEQAAKLISEVKACPIEEARELAGRLIIPLLKDVAKADAETALNKFKSIKVTGRMTISRKK